MDCTVEMGGWQFCFDRDVTAKYYENYTELCQCASCRNFYANVEHISPELKNFLEQFGVDVAKPIELMSITADREEMCVENTLYYAVHGTATSLEKPWIQVGESSIRIQSENGSPNTDIAEPYFVIEANDVWLPWTSEESLDECYGYERKAFDWGFKRKRK